MISNWMRVSDWMRMFFRCYCWFSLAQSLAFLTMLMRVCLLMHHCECSSSCCNKRFQFHWLSLIHWLIECREHFNGHCVCVDVLNKSLLLIECSHSTVSMCFFLCSKRVRFNMLLSFYELELMLSKRSNSNTNTIDISIAYKMDHTHSLTQVSISSLSQFNSNFFRLI